MKHKFPYLLFLLMGSPPVRGAWIETSGRLEDAQWCPVAPRAGGVD